MRKTLIYLGGLYILLQTAAILAWEGPSYETLQKEIEAGEEATLAEEEFLHALPDQNAHPLDLIIKNCYSENYPGDIQLECRGALVLPPGLTPEYPRAKPQQKYRWPFCWLVECKDT